MTDMGISSSTSKGRAGRHKKGTGTDSPKQGQPSTPDYQGRAQRRISFLWRLRLFLAVVSVLTTVGLLLGLRALHVKDGSSFPIKPDHTNYFRGSGSLNWTVLVTVNIGFYDFFLNWAAHFDRIEGLRGIEVIVVAEDDKVFEKLRDDPTIPSTFRFERSRLELEEKPTNENNNGIAQTKDKTKSKGKTQNTGSNENERKDTDKALDYQSPNYLKMVSTRADVIAKKLELGLNVLYSDMDTVWLSDPMPHIHAAFQSAHGNGNGGVDLVAQLDELPGGEDPTKVLYYCTGFMAIRSTPASLQLMKAWDQALQTPQLNQPVFNDLLKKAAKRGRLRHAPLPMDRFPHGGRYFTEINYKNFTSHRNKACNNMTVVVHNNYIVGHENKRQRFQQYGLWLVPSWEERRFEQICPSPDDKGPTHNYDLVKGKGWHHAISWLDEAWNEIALQEMTNASIHFDLPLPPNNHNDNAKHLPDFPYTLLACGSRCASGMQLLRRWGVTDHWSMQVKFPGFPAMGTHKKFIQDHVFRNIVIDFSKLGGFLSTMNHFLVMDHLINGNVPEEVLVVEDDAIAVPHFVDKMRLILQQIRDNNIDWDVVYVGTCCELQSNSKAVSRNLVPATRDRCANGYLINKKCASKIMDKGALVNEYIPIDWLMTRYREELDLKFFFASPPLIYEGSKEIDRLTCANRTVQN